MTPSTVRIAKPEDYVEIWRLILQGHRETGCFTLAPAKVDWWLARILRPENLEPWDMGPRGAIGVIGVVGKLEAMCFVVFGSAWYSNETYLEEHLSIVDPEYRRSGHAKALVVWMKEQSTAMGLPLMSAELTNVKTESKIKLYERMLPKAGTFFLWNCKEMGGNLAVAASS